MDYANEIRPTWFVIQSDINLSRDVIPAKPGIQEDTGFPRVKHGASLVKPEMTNYRGLMWSCIINFGNKGCQIKRVVL